MTGAELTVTSGQVLALRLFDVAYEIDLKRAEECWARSARGTSARSRLVGTPAKAVSFGIPPLALEFPARSLVVGGRTVAASVSVRLYDFGVAALTLRVACAALPWRDYVRLVNATNEAVGPTAQTEIWEAILADLRAGLGPALIRPSKSPVQEDYLIAVVDAFDRTLTGDALQELVDLVPLLSGEERPLSEGARRDILRHRFSYYPDDLVAITWDRAFIYEPRRETDVIDVLEIANAQLLEMRVYDELLDDELPRMHDLVEATRRRTNPLASRRYARLARRLYTLVAEVTEIAERVDNALQVTEDVYLARLYASAMELFRVKNVSAAVDRKLAIIRETYTALHSEAAEGRAELLEIAVVTLIAVELALSIWRH